MDDSHQVRMEAYADEIIILQRNRNYLKKKQIVTKLINEGKNNQ